MLRMSSSRQLLFRPAPFHPQVDVDEGRGCAICPGGSLARSNYRNYKMKTANITSLIKNVLTYVY